MSKTSENYYKKCRDTAGLTREEAAYQLNISSRTLFDYETYVRAVPDDVVYTMCSIYRAPLLAWLHLKNTSKLGSLLPEVVMPQSGGDMVFQLLLSDDELDKAIENSKAVFADGQITKDEVGIFNVTLQKLKRIAGRVTSALIYGEQILSERGSERYAASDILRTRRCNGTFRLRSGKSLSSNQDPAGRT